MPFLSDLLSKTQQQNNPSQQAAQQQLAEAKLRIALKKKREREEAARLEAEMQAEQDSLFQVEQEDRMQKALRYGGVLGGLEQAYDGVNARKQVALESMQGAFDETADRAMQAGQGVIDGVVDAGQGMADKIVGASQGLSDAIGWPGKVNAYRRLLKEGGQFIPPQQKGGDAIIVRPSGGRVIVPAAELEALMK